MARSNCWRISPGTLFQRNYGAFWEPVENALIAIYATASKPGLVFGSSQGSEAGSHHSPLTTCDGTDEFCDCGDLGRIYSLITVEDLCARHYWKEASAIADRGFGGWPQEASRKGRPQPRKA
jgi:hypothetical protein